MKPVHSLNVIPSLPAPLEGLRRLSYNLRWTWDHFVNAMLWKAFRDRTNAARALFKLPPRKTVWTESPMVYNVSPLLLPTTADWPANVHLCGRWLAPSPAWMPPPALERIVAS